jgi:hypothetical protein
MSCAAGKKLEEANEDRWVETEEEEKAKDIHRDDTEEEEEEEEEAKENLPVGTEGDEQK